MLKKVSARKTSQAEISYENAGVPLDQMKVSERRAEPKKAEKAFTTIIKKTHQFHGIKK